MSHMGEECIVQGDSVKGPFKDHASSELAGSGDFIFG